MDTKKAEQAKHSQENERDIEKREGADDAAGSKKSKKKEAPAVDATKQSSAKAKPKLKKNNVRKLRMERMMSKAELARRAGLSTLTIDRVEKGMPCRMDTKRKILEALGLTPSDRETVFGEDY
jgi:DNA-binding XRE family transcriptional regulator